jgi:anti-sigma factor RsiW
VTEAALQHQRFQELIARFADGELPGEGRRVIEEHLRACGRCQRELALQQGLSRALALEPMLAASDSLRRRIERLGEPR